MRALFQVLIAVSFIAVVSGQSVAVPPPSAASAKRPADILPDSLSRLPLVRRADMDENGKRVYDMVAGKDRTTPLLGPGAISFYSPRVAEPMHALNDYLRRESVIGNRFFELCALIAAREFDQQYEWSGHEPGALRVGLEQKVIDVVKYNKDVAGLSERDSTIIRLGRQLFREHKVDSALYAKTVELFGRQGTFEITAVMGDYAMAAIMLTGPDQHLPADRKELLPPR